MWGGGLRVCGEEGRLQQQDRIITTLRREARQSLTPHPAPLRPKPQTLNGSAARHLRAEREAPPLAGAERAAPPLLRPRCLHLRIWALEHEAYRLGVEVSGL